MANKINYGIDLGTTNSAIARMENGVPVIKKSDTQKDTTPSCVNFNKRQSILVGDSAANALKQDKLRAMKDFKSDSNTFIEFKRTMGTDILYASSNMDRNYSSEELSAEVLKKLKSYITDGEIPAVVITVPAKFTINQKDATTRAAKLAGFAHCELLQEPIAASMAYGIDASQKSGYWLVFDFGGGTFDAALLKVEDGIMRVIDTDGDNYLGGKNIDYAIVDEIIIPYLKKNFTIDKILADSVKREVLRDAVKYFAEETKIAMSSNETHNVLSDLGDIPGTDDEGSEFELDITITQADMKRVVAPIFQKAIDICKDLLKRNNMDGGALGSLILVGGPTYSPILRQMLKEQITAQVATNVDPMTVVAKGAALFAATTDIHETVVESKRDRTKIQLGIGYEATTVEMEEWVTLKILHDKTEGEIPSGVQAEVVRSDKAWASGKIEINEKGSVVEVKLNGGKPNSFIVSVYDGSGNLLPSEPSEFTIIQGSKIGSAPLPYNIGIEIKLRATGRIVFQPVKGLEKNQSTPATGVINGLKTPGAVRPGNRQDFIRIPIYQGDYGAGGSRAAYNEHVYDVIITGDDLPALLPEGSDLDLTITVDRSERISCKAFFPLLDHTAIIEVPTNNVQKEIDADWLEKEIGKARAGLAHARETATDSDHTSLLRIEEDLNYLDKRLEQGRGDADRKKEVLEGLRRALKDIDKLIEKSEWPRLETLLREEFNRLEDANADLGNERTTQRVNLMRGRLDAVLKEKNIKVGQALLEEIESFFFAITYIYQLINYINHYDSNFGQYHWKDRGRARQLVDEGVHILHTTPANQLNADQLRPIVLSIIKLLPEDEVPESEAGILHK